MILTQQAWGKGEEEEIKNVAQRWMGIRKDCRRKSIIWKKKIANTNYIISKHCLVLN